MEDYEIICYILHFNSGIRNFKFLNFNILFKI